MTVFGWDASHFDAVPDGARVVAEGFKFMTHKAGGDASDAELGAWWNAVKGQRGKLLLGAYWVLYPGDPVIRANSFIARLDSQCPGWRDGPFILQADCEKWNGDASTVPPISQINAFCDRLAVRLPKLNPIVYAPEWVYGSKVSALRYPLWASSYVTGSGTAQHLYPGDSSSRWGAYGGREPSILQFTSSATIAGQTTCDANAFRGTLDQLTALLAPGWKPAEEKTMNLTDKVGSEAYPGRTLEDFFNDFWGMRDPLVVGTSKTPALPAGSPLAKLLALPGQVAALSAAVGQLEGVDTDAVVAGVLAGLTPEAIAAAIPADIAQQVADILAERLQA
jgi:lysozyme